MIKKCVKLDKKLVEKLERCEKAREDAGAITIEDWLKILESVKSEFPWKKMNIIWEILDSITQDSAARGMVMIRDVEALCYDICNDSVDGIWGCLYPKR